MRVLGQCGKLFGVETALATAGANHVNVVTDVSMRGIPGASHQTVLCKTLSGRFQPAYLAAIALHANHYRTALVDDHLEPIVYNLAYAN